MEFPARYSLLCSLFSAKKSYFVAVVEHLDKTERDFDDCFYFTPFDTRVAVLFVLSLLPCSYFDCICIRNLLRCQYIATTVRQNKSIGKIK